MLFTGEMVFPWMFDDFACLQPYKQAANLIAAKQDWPKLYRPEVLQAITVSLLSGVGGGGGGGEGGPRGEVGRALRRGWRGGVRRHGRSLRKGLQVSHRMPVTLLVLQLQRAARKQGLG